MGSGATSGEVEKGSILIFYPSLLLGFRFIMFIRGGPIEPITFWVLRHC
jgi:hypothetical protein